MLVKSPVSTKLTETSTVITLQPVLVLLYLVNEDQFAFLDYSSGMTVTVYSYAQDNCFNVPCRTDPDYSATGILTLCCDAFYDSGYCVQGLYYIQ